MKIYSYTDKIKQRIRALWLLAVGMIVYMIAVGELGLGDSRMMTKFANITSDIIFFGGFIYVVYRIIYNKRLLKNRSLLKDNMQLELDERNQYLHDKSGGIVVDILLILLLFITLTAALSNMAAFNVSAAVLMITILLKLMAYFVYCHKYIP